MPTVRVIRDEMASKQAHERPTFQRIVCTSVCAKTNGVFLCTNILVRFLLCKHVVIRNKMQYWAICQLFESFHSSNKWSFLRLNWFLSYFIYWKLNYLKGIIANKNKKFIATRQFSWFLMHCNAQTICALSKSYDIEHSFCNIS